MEEIVHEWSLVAIQGWPVLRIGYEWGAQWMMTESGFLSRHNVSDVDLNLRPQWITSFNRPIYRMMYAEILIWKSCPHREWSAVPSLKVFHWNSSGRHHKLTWYTLPSYKCLAIIPNCRLLTQKLTLQFLKLDIFFCFSVDTWVFDLVKILFYNNVLTLTYWYYVKIKLL